MTNCRCWKRQTVIGSSCSAIGIVLCFIAVNIMIVRKIERSAFSKIMLNGRPSSSSSYATKSIWINLFCFENKSVGFFSRRGKTARESIVVTGGRKKRERSHRTNGPRNAAQARTLPLPSCVWTCARKRGRRGVYNAGNLTRGMIKALTNVSLSVAGCRNQGLAEVSRRSIQRKYSTISFFVDRIKNFRIVKDQKERDIRLYDQWPQFIELCLDEIYSFLFEGKVER